MSDGRFRQTQETPEESHVNQTHKKIIKPVTNLNTRLVGKYELIYVNLIFLMYFLMIIVNLLSANPTKCSKIFKQFVDSCR